MAEQIGKVILDDTFYPGEDLYCDGAVEDTLLSIVQNYPESEYPRLIEENGSWPVLYHLSHLRENIVNWLPVDKSMKVLEVGSGCGAITGALADRAGSVTCVDLSRKRSLINAYRHRNADNITIKMGNFKDIEPTLDTDYDYVFLIGVFEYGQGYMGTDTPYPDFMKILHRHLAEHGRLVIAIENKYGLKYFAGCREDHIGGYFTGIEDYQTGGGVRTFSRAGLEAICRECGIGDYHFYYPYPDYKFMTTIYSDRYLPHVGELSNNLRNFDRERMLLFDEKNVFDGLIRDGMFPEFSNSFLLVIGKEPEQIFSKFSNDRAPRYAIRTDICKTGTAEGGLQECAAYYVEKHADLAEAGQHIVQLQRSYQLLNEKYTGSGMEINRCEMAGSGARFDFITGDTLESVLDECIYRDDEAAFLKNLERFEKVAAYREEVPVCDYDLIFSNILVEEQEGAARWTLIDYEWTLEEAIPAKKLMQRAIFIYLLGPVARKKWLLAHGIAQKYDVFAENLEELQAQELIFQRHVTEGRSSMYELYDRMGQPVLQTYESVSAQKAEENEKKFQVYENTGAGFSEAQSYFVENAYTEIKSGRNSGEKQTGKADGANSRQEADIFVKLSFDASMKQLRLDPAMESCMLYETHISLNGVTLAGCESHGQTGVPSSQETPPIQCNALNCNGTALDAATYVFATQDPNLTLDLTEMKLRDRNELIFSAKLDTLSSEAAKRLAGLAQKPIKKSFYTRMRAKGTH